MVKEQVREGKKTEEIPINENEAEMFTKFQTGIFALFDEIYKGTPLHNNCAPLYAAAVNTFGYIYMAVDVKKRKELLKSFSDDIKSSFTNS